ncbi:twin-arginine translocase TatA/TatE family subunit [Leucothrix mucor]|uniref:twin-arginine translocase TatA/TatE family subunit n=1 Tax=Leucothrix mucor TaxID=45248 RepID=UPI0003B616AD|nr:twin-arginine translocase TatA/TatE family subunit [Leucothrix mucor]
MLLAIGMPGVGSLVLILVIVLVLFGTKRLRDAGGDLGGAIKNFKKSLNDAKNGTEEADEKPVEKVTQDNSKVIDAEVKVKDQDKV